MRNITKTWLLAALWAAAEVTWAEPPSVEDAWARATPPGARTGTIYFGLRAEGGDHLIGAASPTQAAEYVEYFDPAFHGLTGPFDALFALSRAAESLFFIPPGQNTDACLVSHSNNVILLNPDGKLHAIFTSPHTSDRLADDFVSVAAQYAAL